MNIYLEILFIFQFFSGEIEEKDLSRPYGKEAVIETPDEKKGESEEKRKEIKNEEKEIVTDRIKIAEENYKKYQEQKEQERIVREKMAKEKKNAKKERNKKTRIMMKRTKKGQPVFSLQLAQLMSKIENPNPKKG